ncbi:hypothetical protein HDU91_003692, partial [Kappamyces sp. JEL0680]
MFGLRPSLVRLEHKAAYRFPLQNINEILSGPVSSGPVSVSAWISSIRNQKHTTFLTLNDGSNSDGLQAVIDSAKLKTMLRDTSLLTTGSSVTLAGTLVALKDRKQPFEVAIDSLQLIGSADPT